MNETQATAQEPTSKTVVVSHNVFEVPMKITRHDNIRITANSPEDALEKVKKLYDGANCKIEFGLPKFHSRFEAKEILQASPDYGY